MSRKAERELAKHRAARAAARAALTARVTHLRGALTPARIGARLLTRLSAKSRGAAARVGKEPGLLASGLAVLGVSLGLAHKPTARGVRKLGSQGLELALQWAPRLADGWWRKLRGKR